MVEQTTVETARAFTEAWTRQDMEAAGSYLTDDVVFDGPLGHAEGKTEYLAGLSGLSRNLGVNGVRIVAAFGDEAQVLIMYELLTEKVGPLTCAKLLSFRDGKIFSDRLTFDSYQVRAS